MIERWISSRFLFFISSCRPAKRPAPSGQTGSTSEKAASPGGVRQDTAALNILRAGKSRRPWNRTPLSRWARRRGRGEAAVRAGVHDLKEAKVDPSSRVQGHRPLHDLASGGKVFEDTRATNTPRELKLSKLDLMSGLVDIPSPP